MLDVAERLAADFAFARIDLYNVDGRIYFGEITHNPGGGLVRLRPRAFDRALGELWRTGTPIPERFIRRPRATVAQSGDRM
jgi:teichuronopeptide biosynthesis TupA-like protein